MTDIHALIVHATRDELYVIKLQRVGEVLKWFFSNTTDIFNEALSIYRENPTLSREEAAQLISNRLHIPILPKRVFEVVDYYTPFDYLEGDLG